MGPPESTFQSSPKVRVYFANTPFPTPSYFPPSITPDVAQRQSELIGQGF